MKKLLGALVKRLLNLGEKELSDKLVDEGKKLVSNGASAFVVKLLMSHVVPRVERLKIQAMDMIVKKLRATLIPLSEKVNYDPKYKEAVILVTSSLVELTDEINDIVNECLINIGVSYKDFKVIKDSINDESVAIDTLVEDSDEEIIN